MPWSWDVVGLQDRRVARTQDFAQERAAFLVVVDHENREPGEVEDLLQGIRAYRAASCAARWIYEARVSLPTCAMVPLPTGVGTMDDTEIRSSVELS